MGQVCIEHYFTELIEKETYMKKYFSKSTFSQYHFLDKTGNYSLLEKYSKEDKNEGVFRLYAINSEG